MKIGLDIMGGDFAPEASIDGALLAQSLISAEDKIVLIGDKSIILKTIKAKGGDASLFEIIHASENIEMCESPVKAYNIKPDSSIVVGFHKLKSGEIDSFGSAGNTGAMLVGSIYTVNAIQGVIRPCLPSILPKENGGMGIILDVGTVPDCKPDVLYQFAILGSLFAEFVYKIDKPKVGLLNIGEEEEKGNIAVQATYRLMKDTTDFNFIGNVESRDLFNDKADVIVTDGFTGNIVLKQAETMYTLLAKRGFLDDFFKRFDYENYGAIPLLGINGTVMIGHGISNAKAFSSMILMSKNVHEAGLAKKIKKAMTSHHSEE